MGKEGSAEGQEDHAFTPELEETEDSLRKIGID